MKIESRCRVCKREFPIDLILTGESGGHCPFCGVPLDPNYNGNLIRALAGLQRAGTAIEGALEQVRDLGGNLELDAHSIVEPIRDALARRTQAGVGT